MIQPFPRRRSPDEIALALASMNTMAAAQGPKGTQSRRIADDIEPTPIPGMGTIMSAPGGPNDRPFTPEPTYAANGNIGPSYVNQPSGAGSTANLLPSGIPVNPWGEPTVDIGYYGRGNANPYQPQPYDPSVYSGPGTSASFALPRDDPDYGNPNYIGLGNGQGMPRWVRPAIGTAGAIVGGAVGGPIGAGIGRLAGNALGYAIGTAGYNPNRPGVPADAPLFAGAGRAPWVVNPGPGRTVTFGPDPGSAIPTPSTMGVETPAYTPYNTSGFNVGRVYSAPNIHDPNADYGDAVLRGDPTVRDRLQAAGQIRGGVRFGGG